MIYFALQINDVLNWENITTSSYVYVAATWFVSFSALMLLLIKFKSKNRKARTLLRLQIIIIRHLMPAFFPEMQQRLKEQEKLCYIALLYGAAAVLGFFITTLHMEKKIRYTWVFVNTLLINLSIIHWMGETHGDLKKEYAQAAEHPFWHIIVFVNSIIVTEYYNW